jgi:hypothetical protein
MLLRYLKLAYVLRPTLRIVEVGQEQLFLPLCIAGSAQLPLKKRRRREIFLICDFPEASLSSAFDTF